jgi:hypothetical protein
MKYLRLFESFELSVEDVKDLLQDVIDEFNLRTALVFGDTSLDTYRIDSFGFKIEVRIYVRKSIYNSNEFKSQVSDFITRLKSLGYGGVSDDRTSSLFWDDWCMKKITISNI